jgi:hypothetical protein
MTGTCKFFRHSRPGDDGRSRGHFGFIDCGEDQQFFFHGSDLADQSESAYPIGGDTLDFDLGEDPKSGRTVALNVRVVSRPVSRAATDHVAPEVQAVLGQQLTGRITSFRPNEYGFILLDHGEAPLLRRRSIYFQNRDCEGHFTPAMGDKVSGVLIYAPGGLRLVDVRLVARALPAEHISPV